MFFNRVKTVYFSPIIQISTGMSLFAMNNFVQIIWDTAILKNYICVIYKYKLYYNAIFCIKKNLIKYQKH